MEAVTLVGAMVAGGLAGLFAGLGARATQPLDRHAEMWFAIAVWSVCTVGAVIDGLVGRAMVVGALGTVALWSVMHFPNVQTLETEAPRRLPLATLSASVATAAVMVLLTAAA